MSSSNVSSMNDFLFILLLSFLAMLVLAIICMEDPTKKKKDIESKAEFIITMTWPDEDENDIDLFTEDPNGNVAFFSSREIGVLSLDRDDLGLTNDTVRLKDGTILYVKQNREVMSVRGIIPGEFVVNILLYQRKDNLSTEIPVTIVIDKINPFSTVIKKTVYLNIQGQEETICRFTLDPEGNIVSINYLPKSLVNNSGE